MNVITGKRSAISLAQMLENGWAGFDQLEKLTNRAQPDAFRPSEKVARMIHALTLNPDTAEIVEWLMDITLRAPLRLPDAGFEQVALAYATRKGINGVGEAVLAALEMGRELMEKLNASHQQTDE